MVAPVLIVSGSTAVGKSTVSRLLVGQLTPSVHMRIDDILGWFDDPFPDAMSPEGEHRYKVVGAAAAAAAAQLALGDYTVLLDSPMFPNGADGVAEICGRRGVPVHYAVLRADFDTCVARSCRRDQAGPLDSDGIASLHARFIDLGQREEHVIDASPPPQDVAEQILCAFREGRLALSQRP
jgi:hypothetical protein